LPGAYFPKEMYLDDNKEFTHRSINEENPILKNKFDKATPLI
jgi:hypothetical protein